jgi:hypothetical protein
VIDFLPNSNKRAALAAIYTHKNFNFFILLSIFIGFIKMKKEPEAGGQEHAGERGGCRWRAGRSREKMATRGTGI